ncbi:alpha/beta-hydrolase [Mollisia scopiformis]|uniref:Alpha/beta-hydrolase n=1 Tax=Mollisia scopiformis TaxID=149040 RepID=A0A132BE67_MOLSC|nr:alpha/beta-hydrolase [Mollisia scopiformis]KUJ10543.1 alpha/beta-hydrolase [Mollisia scopiformis]
MQLLATVATFVAFAAFGHCQSITKVNAFKDGPTNLGMAIHHCQGSATAYSTESHYMPLADSHGFILIYPNSRSSALTHNGRGDSQTIVNMVKYAVTNYGGDANRTFVTGTSSGAMMTNVMVGAYPDVFKAGSAYSGVPDGCFYVSGATATQDPPGWSNSCANGQLTKTAQEWGDLVRSYYPSYTGPRPRMQIWHGTADNTLHYPNYAEAMKEWSNVLALTTSKTASNTPQSGYTQTIYGDGTSATAQLVGYSAAGVGHTVPVHESMDLAFLGITSIFLTFSAISAFSAFSASSSSSATSAVGAGCPT